MDVCVTIKDNVIEVIDNAESVGVLIGVDLMLDAFKPFFEKENYLYKYDELKNRIQMAIARLS